MPDYARTAKIFVTLILLTAGRFLLPAAGSFDRARIQERLRMDVEFLSDSLCDGRKTGTAGASAAAFYIIHRMNSLGYEVGIDAFAAPDSAAGHNIVARPKSPGKKAPVLLMAYYDGHGCIGGKFYPGADSNASGVAALLFLAESLKDRNDIIIAFVDGHNANMSGAEALKLYLKHQRLRMTVNLDILGSTLAPPDKFWKNYLIALGGAPYQRSLERANTDTALHLYYNYYGSRSFTELFYRRISDHKVFFDRGIPVLMFTSGITLNTNRDADTAATLDYGIYAERVELICNWLSNISF